MTQQDKEQLKLEIDHIFESGANEIRVFEMVVNFIDSRNGVNKNFVLADVSRSALRYNSGKLQWSLVDFDALEDMVKVLEFGAKKYAADNWKKGLKTNEIAESMMRHLFAYLRGEDIDPESGLPHTGHIMCNAMFLSYMQKFAPKFDLIINKLENNYKKSAFLFDNYK